ncbi:EAL domain-containing protein [Thalassotalea sp. LPB0316]|uniref:EAL domain-containing protein n=1 Tax=Thalassotalea sp. LPB0316 TaxID=2769490 RepID=UPI0018675E7E|nr:EAL domain-containing protein [Thalassotalea sp. LPB0316]QOL24908.1 EAL domain-containing protein [Thalassotalea sp. LPB0316]
MINNSRLTRYSKPAFIAIFLLLTIFVLQSAISFLHQYTQKTVVVQDNIDTSYRYFIDRKQTASPQTIMSMSSQFILEDADKIPYDLADQTYWIIGNYTNNSNQNNNMVLHIDNAMLDTLEIYQVDQFMNVNLVYSLANYQADNLMQTFPHFQFQLGGYQDITLLIKLKTYGPPEIPLKLYKGNGFSLNVTASIGLYGAFVGCIILMALYNIVLYFAIKDKVYLAYLAYLASTFLTVTSLNGFGYLLFSYDLQQWFQSHIIQINIIIITSLLLFTCYFLQYDQEKSSIYRISVFLSIMLIILGIFLQFTDLITQAKAFFAIQPFFYLYAIAIIVNKLTTTFTWARFYFISWLPLLTGAAIQPLALLNIIDSSFWTNHAFLIGVMFETIFMAFALGERMRMSEQQKVATLTYHQETKILKSLNLANRIKQLKAQGEKRFTVLAIEPEKISTVSLYIENHEVNNLYKSIERGLNSLFLYNDKVETLFNDQQKVCIDETGIIFVLFKEQQDEELSVFIESILRKFKEIYCVKQVNFPLGATVGVAINHSNDIKTEALMQQAKLAIEQAKSAHLPWQVYQEDSHKKDAYLLDLAAEMITAFNNGEFELLHQPQVDLKTLKVCGSEVLIRWTKSDGTIVPNSVLIPLATDIGLIKSISRWVFKQALKQQKEIIDTGYQSHLISINMTNHDLADQDFYPFVAQTIKENNIPTENIAIELTEPGTLINNSRIVENMKRLNTLGFILSVDDFGEGDSNISHISKLPCQEVKLDNQFIESLLSLPKQRQIIAGTIEIAKSLNIEVVAEGINNQEQELQLRELGCDIGQGYFYSEPLVLSEYLKWLEKNRLGLNR